MDKEFNYDFDYQKLHVSANNSTANSFVKAESNKKYIYAINLQLWPLFHYARSKASERNLIFFVRIQIMIKKNPHWEITNTLFGEKEKISSLLLNCACYSNVL